MDIAISILPVILFLVFLFAMDSFKLVSYKLLSFSIVWGVFAAILSYFINSYLLLDSANSFTVYSRFQAPVIEELLKALSVLFLVSLKKIGFSIDAIVYGFATGAGFSLAENLYFLTANPDPNLLVWVIRGFGTAIMHGGCTALLAMIIVGGINRHRIAFTNILAGLIIATSLHSLFNHFYIDPVLQTLGVVVVIPVLFILIFHFKEKGLRKWLDMEFYSEIELLSKINKGEVSNTKAGEYLKSLRERFRPEAILDMYCYLALYLELSIKAKRNIMLRESGLEPPTESDIEQKLKELAQLRKNIGKIGELTLAPLVKMKYNDLWKLKQLS
ncbi:MAG: PrsW family glutamic-type intramembrane protease [Bacteroidales bacterium]|jgi:RsiW-degrading membrane proteinase PrsW (M82 family)|nr:PrsW family glutamic-type intramembrane protease [Bacteroidales bacterium]MDD4058700.1 PrsW family glutamic-type intramembrane protease [Bacteroidales bacterium]